MDHQPLNKNSIFSGFRYLTQGVGILLQPGMKRFVFVPILANCIVFIILTLFLFQHFSNIQQWLAALTPDTDWGWFNFLKSILTYFIAFISGLIIFLILLVYGYSFTLLTNIIAAPFYGMLAEKIEHHVTGESVASEPIGDMVIRTLRREIVKLFYFITRGILVVIGLFFLSLIPLVQLIVPLLTILWGAWVMTLQYIDYPADNHQLPFTSLRQRMKQPRYSTIGFGGTIMFCSMIPVVNIFIMPIAVAGGTLFWINELRQNLLADNSIKTG